MLPTTWHVNDRAGLGSKKRIGSADCRISFAASQKYSREEPFFSSD